MEMPFGIYNSNDRLKLGIQKGRMTFQDVEQAARHVLYGLGSCGYLSLVELDASGAVKEEEGRTESIRLRDHYKEALLSDIFKRNQIICKRTAQEGSVLLKNEQALPLKKEDYTDGHSIAVLGLGGKYLISGQGQERSYGTLSRMKAPVDELIKIAGENASIHTKTGIDLVGVTVPEEYLYLDNTGKTRGVKRTWGILKEDVCIAPNPFDFGGAGQELKGMAMSENEDDQDVIPFFPDMNQDLSVDVENHRTGSLVRLESVIDFTCGTIDGAVNQTYRNSKNGTAFHNGEAYTFEGYLKTPETGEYDLMMESIGGTARFYLEIDEKGLKEVASSDTREGTQWPWGSLICTQEGMEIKGIRVHLEKDRLYHFRFLAHASVKNKDMQLRFAWNTPSQKEKDYKEALELAKTADKVILFFCDDYKLPTPEEVFGIDFDSYKGMYVAEEQMKFAEDVRREMKESAKLIGVIGTSQILALGKLEKQLDALLHVGMIGQEGGAVIAELLLGRSNPSGKLTVSIPRNEEDTILTDTEEHMHTRGMGVKEPDGNVRVHFDEGIFTGYRWFDQQKERKALYPFGYGLSYTTFSYKNLKASVENGVHQVSFDVTNTGNMRGTEIAQVYLGAGEVPEHIQMAKKQLCGFIRIRDIQPDCTRHITLTIPERSFCYWDPEQKLVQREDGTRDKWIKAKGIRKVYVGGSSEQIYLEDEFKE